MTWWYCNIVVAVFLTNIEYPVFPHCAALLQKRKKTTIFFQIFLRINSHKTVQPCKQWCTEIICWYLHLETLEQIMWPQQMCRTFHLQYWTSRWFEHFLKALLHIITMYQSVIYLNIFTWTTFSHNIMTTHSDYPMLLFVGDILRASEHLVRKVAGKMFRDSSFEFNKFWISDNWDRASPKLQLFWGVLVFIYQRRFNLGLDLF